jgi:hypothetical protein
VPEPTEVFLSYCWKDNTTTEQVDEKEEPLGWADYLERRLSALVSMYRGVQTNVWRDASDMRGNFQLSEDVYGALDSARLFVAVLSESYLRSDWCPDEFDRFRRRAKTEAHLGEWKRRIFHLFRTPLQGTPSEIADAKHYEFFLRRSNADKDHVPFEPNPKSDFKAHFDRLLTDLASDLAKALSPPAGAISKGTVYLASPSPDLQLRFISLCTELKDHNFTVLPDPALPSTGFANAVREQLDRSDCCVFPIGAETMLPIEGADPCETQLQLALEACDPVRRPLLVWLPPASGEPSSPLVRDLVAGKIARPGLEVRRSEFPPFKTDLFQWLKALRDKQAAAASATRSPARGALIYDLCDLGDAALVRLEVALRRDRALRLAVPDFQGAPAELREAERQQLEEAPFVLLFAGASSEQWLATKRAALKANPGQSARKVGVLLLDDDRQFKRDAAAELGASALLTKPGDLNDANLKNWLDGIL